jgi:hypothetical protein
MRSVASRPLPPSSSSARAPARISGRLGRHSRAIDVRQLAMDFDAPSRAATASHPAPLLVALPPEPKVSLESVPTSVALATSTTQAGLDDTHRHHAAAWRVERSLEAALGASRVVWTQNRRTVLSSRRVEAGLVVRLHRVFATADDAVLDALGRYLKTGERRASTAISRFVDESRSRIAGAEPARTRPLVSRGAVHDLGGLFEELAMEHFLGRMDGVAITWGRPSPRRRRRRSIRLGTYSKDELLIRVHPALDQDWVPRFFVRFIVFHEMLHHVEPAREGRGRTEFHTKSFRTRERAFHDHDRAIAWERTHLSRLLRG